MTYATNGSGPKPEGGKLVRYIILVIVLLSDIIKPAAAALLLCITYQISFGLFMIACLLMVAEFKKWSRDGGFEEWRPPKIKRFLDKARKIGL